jgi:hypothetical protein
MGLALFNHLSLHSAIVFGHSLFNLRKHRVATKFLVVNM